MCEQHGSGYTVRIDGDVDVGTDVQPAMKRSRAIRAVLRRCDVDEGGNYLDHGFNGGDHAFDDEPTRSGEGDEPTR